MTTEVEAVVERVLVNAKCKAKPDAVFHATMRIGDYHRQGDVYVQRITPPYRNKIKEITVRIQVAPGSTQGSRHCITGATLRHLRMYKKTTATALDGPIIEAFNPVEIGHPEHGHVTIPPGWYAITFQRAYAEELRRVQD